MHRALAIGLGLLLCCGPSTVDSTGTTSTSTTDGTSGASNTTGVSLDSTSTPSTSISTSTSTPPLTSTSTDDSDTSAETTEGVAPGSPDRLFIFYTPHGFYQQSAYSGTGEDFVLHSMLAPLEPWADHMLMVEGISNFGVDPEGIEVMDAHSTASASLLTGGLLGSGVNKDELFNPHYAGGPSLDVVLGETLSSGLPISSVHLGVRELPDTVTFPMSVSYLGLDEPNLPLNDPAEAFEALFFGIEDPQIEALGESVQDIDPLDYVGLTNAHLDLTVAALAHDVTRVSLLTNDIGIPRIWWVPLGLNESFHFALVENNPDLVEPVYTFWGERLAQALQQMGETPVDDGGSLLDSTLVVWLSDMGSVAAAHPRTSALVVIIDTSDTMATGQVIEVKADQADLAATLATALGVELGKFGHPELGATPIDELLAKP